MHNQVQILINVHIVAASAKSMFKHKGTTCWIDTKETHPGISTFIHVCKFSLSIHNITAYTSYFYKYIFSAKHVINATSPNIFSKYATKSEGIL